MSSESDELAREQHYVTMLYQRLDYLRDLASDELAQVRRDSAGTSQHLVERDVATRELGSRLVQLDAAEDGLCFGRLDLETGERHYVGRIGMLDDKSDYEPLLIDWRAPAARPFYVATSAEPLGVQLRRHIRTRMRTVLGLDDDVLANVLLDAGIDDAAKDHPSATPLVGEGALLASLASARTGRMRDVVETIQAEQDAVIRDRLQGILVVQGGPGTGKTAVALHRAAYLLYTHREQLARRGVLIVGPNTTFLRYISHVLPSLGETSAALLTVGELFPGVSTRRVESAQITEIKGHASMADVLASAVAVLRRLPEEDETVDIVIDGVTYRLSREVCLRAREKALATGEPHNLARPVFVDGIMEELVDQAVERLTADPFKELTDSLLDDIANDLREHGLDLSEDGDGDGTDGTSGEGASDPEEDLLAVIDPEEMRRTLEQEPSVHEALDWLWPDLTPERLLTELFTTPELLFEAAPQLTHAERGALRREPAEAANWSVADVPLLDEAAELLGAFDADEAERRLQRQEEIAYAQGVLDVISGSRSIDFEDPLEERLAVTDLLDAESLADLQADQELRTIAERAVADRTWTFGHVIVDEAQELSAMAWRLLMRRCPSRSMTLVGDVAQTSDPAGARSWRTMLEPFVEDRWRAAELTVNYRTPKEIMDLAATVLARLDPDLRPPRSVRRSGIAPRREQVQVEQLTRRLAQLAGELDASVGEGRFAVIVPRDRTAELTAAVADAVPDAAYGEEPDLERRTVVLTARQAKGLEFDSVLLVDPDAIADDGPRGLNDLYVAMTRTTRELTVLTTGR